MSTALLVLKDVELNVECANGFWAKALGLSMRRAPQGDGMLFRFRCQGRHAIWMMGMRFPLDIVWMNESKVVWVKRYAKPPHRWLLSILFPFLLPRYRSAQPANAVLELPAGSCDMHHIEVGDEVKTI